MPVLISGMGNIEFCFIRSIKHILPAHTHFNSSDKFREDESSSQFFNMVHVELRNIWLAKI